MSADEKHGKKKHSGGHAPHGGGHEEAHEGAPEWLISFADNVTLMMGFFVILLAMNLKPAMSGGGGPSKEPGQPPPSPEMLDLAIAVREAFHNPVDPNSSNPIDLPLIPRLLERSGQSQAERDGQMGREHDVRSIRPANFFSPAGAIHFEQGSIELSDEGRTSLAQLRKVVHGHNLVIEVRGHVSAAEAFESADRGMRLSYDRAARVMMELVAEGLPWEQFRIVACGDGDRLRSTAYEDSAHRDNQRVELLITDLIKRDQ